MPQHASCYHTGYALTCSEYDDLLALAQGRCMACQAPTGRFVIDHDHALGQWAVRGLTCHSCNHYLKSIDSGRAPLGPMFVEYLASAWHRTQASSAVKASRVRQKAPCPGCGFRVAVHANGTLHRHFARPANVLICSGAQLPERPGPARGD
jgi:hypothetical protein